MASKFECVKHMIQKEIASLPPNAKLPSERDLIERFSYSRPTIQKALQELEQEERIYKLPRKGWFVADKKLEKTLNRLQSFKEDILSGGDIPTTKLVSFEKVKADIRIADALAIKPGSPIYRVVRIRCKNGTPIIYDVNHFCLFALEDVTCDVLIDSIYQFLEEKKGLFPTRSVEVIDAVLPSEDIARQLNLSANEPVIKIEMTAYLRDGRPFEFTCSYKNPKKYRLEIRSQRALDA